MHRYTLLLAVLSCSFFLFSQNHGNVSDTVKLKEFTINSLGIPKMIISTPIPVSVIHSASGEGIQVNSPADLLIQAPGVNLMRDGIWATSVNLRGLTDQRIVCLIDGHRLETATDIDGYLSMIDVNDIDKIEVIKNGASSLYGSGALGGVLNIITKHGKFTPKLSMEGQVSSGFHSVNNMIESGLRLQISDQNYHIQASGSFRSAGNTTTPLGELGNSAFNDYSFALKGGIRVQDKNALNFNLQHFKAYDVGFPGGSAFPGPALVSLPEHKRQLAALDYVMNDISEHWTKASIRAYYQYILRDVNVDISTPSQSINISPRGEHYTFGASFENELHLSHHKLFTGLDFFGRAANSTRDKLVTNESAVLLRGEKPLPNAFQSNLGIFLQDDIDLIEDKLNATLGIRWDINNTVNEKAIDPVYLYKNGAQVDVAQRVTFESNNIWNSSYGANAGLHYTPDHRNHFSFSVGRSFRAASIEEKFKYIDLGSKVRIGDPNLKPETSLNFDLGYKLQSDNLSASFNVFYNHIRNMIVEIPGEVQLSTIGTEEATQVQALIGSNVDKALLTGFDGEISYRPFKALQFKGNISYVIGTNETVSSDSTIYLPLMPPPNGFVTLTWFNKYASPEVRFNYAFKQDKLAQGESFTTSYQTIDLLIKKKLYLSNQVLLHLLAGVQNITDVAYTNHLSSNRGLITIEPGRNIFLKMHLKF